MNVDRRGFHLTIIGGLWALIGAAITLPAAVYLMAVPRSKNETDWTDIGEISSLPVGTPQEVVFRRNRVDGWKVVSEKNTAWVVRQSEKDLIALAPQCTHLGCAYHYEAHANEFICPCHTSSFALDGQVLTGPAPRPLDRYEVRVANNRLLIGGVQKPA
jgi:menaquinol-cytochrome c reductase iron-sulfur subunit